jgi:polar amino acid transport system substrate-binding protein
MQTLSDQLTLDLPGFDVDGALARMGGKVPAYIKILGKVLETEANAMERIQQSLNDGDSEAAIRGAHTLKGLSGNIGATVLHSVAADLEAALLDGDEVRSAPLLSQTAQSLDETLDIIKTALSNTEAETPPARATTSAVVIPEPLINQLRKQIDEFDSSAPETSDALHAELRGTEYEALASRLAKALDAYDFDQAQELIEALSQHIANRKGVLSESE